MTFGFALIGGAFGAIIGSYLATIILRWPRGKSASSGRSACDHCDRTLGVADLVPIMSYMTVRGHCRSCGGAIDPLHPSVELAAAVIGMFAFGLFEPMPAAALALFGWILLPLMLLDWRHYWLPDRITVLLLVGGLFLGGWIGGVVFADRLIGAVAGGLFLFGLREAFRQLRGKEGLGLGDVKLVAAIALWLGWRALPILLLIAAGLGLLLALLTRGAPGRQYPFGTLLGISSLGIAFAQARGWSI